MARSSTAVPRRDTGYRSPADSAREVYEKHRDSLVTGFATFLALVLGLVLPVAGYMTEQAPHRLFKIAAAGFLLFFFLSRPVLLLPAIALALPFSDWLPKSPIPLVNAANLMIVGSFFGIAIQSMQHRLPNRQSHSIQIPLLLFAAWILFSWAYGAFLWPDRSGGGFGRLRHLWGVLSGFSVYFIVWYLVPNRKVLWRMVAVLVLGASLAVIGPVAETIQYGFGFRTPGGIGDINKMGAFLAVSSVLVFGLIPLYGGIGKLLTSLGALVTAVALILPNSRGAYVGFLLASFPAALRRSAGSTVLLAAVVSGAALLAPSFVRERVGATWTAAAAEDKETALDADSGGRLTVWKQIVEVIGKSPVVGVGYTNLMEATKLTAGNYKHAHNLYLEVAGEMGLIGLFLLLWILWSGWRLGGTLIRRGGRGKTLGSAYRSVILCYFVLNVFGQRFLDFSLAGFFFYLTGLAAVEETETRDAHSTEVKTA